MGLKNSPKPKLFEMPTAVPPATPEEKFRDGSQPLAPLHTPAHK